MPHPARATPFPGDGQWPARNPTRFRSAFANDWGWHVLNHDVPVSGIGNSGMGSYHAEEGFRELSHANSVFKRNRYFPMELYYPAVRELHAAPPHQVFLRLAHHMV